MIRPILVKAILLSCLLSLTLVACKEDTIPARQENKPRVVAAAGDIAGCGKSNLGDEATAKLLANMDGTVLTLGDNAYENGSPEQYADCYDPTWGRFKSRTKPTPGNHDYHMPEASGYFDYFGAAAGNPDKGYYSYDLGSWHMVSLNSNCEDIGGCGPEAPQLRWLKKDLAANSRKCTLAYFHEPLFTSGKYRPGIPKVRPIWEALYKAGADVILNGHDHNYQRFAPQRPDGASDRSQGIREFVVGTGGKSLYEIGEPIKNTEVSNDDTFGVLKLTLRSNGYKWRFVPVKGETFTDSGSAPCH